MIPGFNTNTSNMFPMISEMTTKINDYIKITCQDIFFDLLQPDYNLNQIVLFYYIIMNDINKRLDDYFMPLSNILKQIIVTDNNLYDPVDIVLRKTYQSNFKNIYNNIEKKYIDFNSVFNILKIKCNLNSDSYDITQEFYLTSFFIFFMCYICEPKIYIDFSMVSKKVEYNSNIHEPLDGFIKQGQSCTIILPSFYRNNVDTKKIDVIKYQVLSKDYFDK